MTLRGGTDVVGCPRHARLRGSAQDIHGADGCKGGWVVVVIDDDGYVDNFIAPDIADAELRGMAEFEATHVVIDIPIGIPDAGPRRADSEARRFFKPRSSSVFSTLVRAALEAPDDNAARIASAAATGGTSLSKQAWAIGDKIREVDEYVGGGKLIAREGHPEVSFRAMAGEPIDHYKKTFPGARLRRALLNSEGIALPDDIESGVKPAATDDIHDAAAMAWTARRIARGTVERFPDADRAERFSDGVDAAIWF